MPSPGDRFVRDDEVEQDRRVVYAAFWALFGLSFVAVGFTRPTTLVSLAFGAVGTAALVLAGYFLLAPATALPTTDVFSRHAADASDADSVSVLVATALTLVILVVAAVLLALFLLP